MNKLILVLALAVGVVAGPADARKPRKASSSSSTSSSEVQVRGHVRKDGVYVPPHTRTKANSTETDNWSSQPNVNPHTGKKGTKKPKR